MRNSRKKGKDLHFRKLILKKRFYSFWYVNLYIVVFVLNPSNKPK